MANHIQWAVLAAMLGSFAASMPGEAHAVPLNHCIKIIRDPQVGRETLVNTCNQCLVAKIERRRPGNEIGTPNMRDFNMPGGTSQPLPFMGPGSTRIMSEAPCPQAITPQP